MAAIRYSKQALSNIIIDLVEVILRLMFETAIYLINVLFVIFYISIKIEYRYLSRKS